MYSVRCKCTNHVRVNPSLPNYWKGITNKLNPLLARGGYSFGVYRCLMAKGIYSNPCTCGSVYIGENGRSIKIRLNEHKSCLRSGLSTHSAFAEHYHQTKHKILIDKRFVATKCSYSIPVRYVNRLSCPSILRILTAIWETKIQSKVFGTHTLKGVNQV